jgi:hypothetical protein
VSHTNAVRRFASRVLRYSRNRVGYATRIWQCDFSPLLPPWSRLRRDESVAGRLRRLAITTAWESVHPLPDRAVTVFFGLVWPLFAPALATRLVWRNGKGVAERSGVPRFRQWLDAVSLAYQYNYSPSTYYQFRAFDCPDSHLRFVQTAEIYMLQLRDNRNVDLRLLADKLRFFDECRRLGIVTPSIFAVLGGDADRWIDAPSGELPRESLFLKWQDGEQGIGYERWVFDAANNSWTRRGVTLDADGMLAHCRRQSASRRLVIQPVIRNHAEIDRLNAGTLCTMRIMTYRNLGAAPALIRASFKIGRAGAEVDNFHAGGIACAVNPDDGALGIGYASHPRESVHTHHPDTGAPIAGTRLPRFRDAIDLALNAHQQLDVPWSVGWDVAITPEGPVLLEGNPMWAGDLGQAPQGEPFDLDFLTHFLARFDPPVRPATPPGAQPPEGVSIAASVKESSKTG